MPKRFIDTGFFKSPFVRGLEGSLKSLYTFIICDCEASGIWVKDLDVATVYTGFKFTDEQFHKHFVETGKAVDLGNGKYFFPDFIEHQYPKGLSEKNIAHNNIIPILLSLNLLDESLKPLKRPFEGSKVMVKVKEEVKEMVKEPKIKKIDFELFYDPYPRKQAKIDGQKAWNKLTEDEKKLAIDCLPKFIAATDPKYYPLPATFLNGKRWLDEFKPKKPEFKSENTKKLTIEYGTTHF